MTDASKNSTLNYATPGSAERPPRGVTIAVWFGSIAIVLFLFVCFAGPCIITPAYRTGTLAQYHFAKTAFGIIPGWASFILALQGGLFAISALIRYPRWRRRAFVGLALCAGVPTLLFIADKLGVLSL